jgi:hypothetical protein
MTGADVDHAAHSLLVPALLADEASGAGMDHLLARAYPEWFAETGVSRTTHIGDSAGAAVRSSPPRWTQGCRWGDVQEAASRADPRTTMRYDRARTSLDRHATYIVAAYVAGAAR